MAEYELNEKDGYTSYQQTLVQLLNNPKVVYGSGNDRYLVDELGFYDKTIMLTTSWKGMTNQKVYADMHLFDLAKSVSCTFWDYHYCEHIRIERGNPKTIAYDWLCRVGRAEKGIERKAAKIVNNAINGVYFSTSLKPSFASRGEEILVETKIPCRLILMSDGDQERLLNLIMQDRQSSFHSDMVRAYQSFQFHRSEYLKAKRQTKEDFLEEMKISKANEEVKK